MVTDAEDVDPRRVCELCGQPATALGTPVDVEVYVDDYDYAGYPAFCSWEHAAHWFSKGKPDYQTWDWDRDPDSPSEGFQYWGLFVVLVVLALAAFGLFSLIRLFI